MSGVYIAAFGGKLYTYAISDSFQKIKIEIDARYCRDNGGDNVSKVRIIIKDNGAGIEEERMKYLKRKLKNADLDSLAVSELKKGIGLVNVKKRLELFEKVMDPVFSIDSVPGHGTTCTIEFRAREGENR